MNIYKKSIIFWGGSGYPNFMNPFEYGKQLLDKSFPKRIGTLTQTKPKIHRGSRYAPPSTSSLDTLKKAGANRVKFPFLFFDSFPYENMP